MITFNLKLTLLNTQIDIMIYRISQIIMQLRLMMKILVTEIEIDQKHLYPSSKRFLYFILRNLMM